MNIINIICCQVNLSPPEDLEGIVNVGNVFNVGNMVFVYFTIHFMVIYVFIPLLIGALLFCSIHTTFM